MPFHLDGTPFSRSSLAAFAQSQLQQPLPLWQQDLYRFIVQWLDNSDSITVSTSGSTGAPKQIQLPKTQVRNSALMTGRYLGLAEGSSALLSLSANYIAGKMMVVRAIENEWHLWCTEPSNQPLQALPPAITIDLVAWVPSQLQAMLDNADDETLHRIQQINTIILGGSPVLPELKERLIHFPNRIFETFGMTETISHIAMKRLSGAATTDFFETTNENIILGQDDRDCLVIIAPNLAAAPIITNDVVVLADERHFQWLGRFDNVVNSGGIKLFPETLEKKVQPLIPYRFFMAGMPDPQLGQKLILVIERDTITTLQKNDIKQRLATVLTRYEIPRDIYAVPIFTQTATHKINRAAILANINA